MIYMDRALQKCVAGLMRTAKTQLSLRIRAVWSWPSLSANKMYEWRTTECRNGEQKWYFAHAQDYLNLRIVRVLEGTFYLTWPEIVFRNPGWTEQLNHDVSKLIHETRKQYTCITGLSCIQDDEVMRRTSSSNDNSKWAIAWAVETLQRCVLNLSFLNDNYIGSVYI